MKHVGHVFLFIMGWLASSTVYAENDKQWYVQGQQAVVEAKKAQANRHTAKNIILFIGDGMGVSTVTAARILEGQLRGEDGEENSLSFELFSNLALAKTYNTNQQTADSAGTMTAIMTGVKTRAGMISVRDASLRGQCQGLKGNILRTFLEEAEEYGKSTGVVTTARLTHATPAATYAHATERAWEDDSALSVKTSKQGCRDIARQLIEFSYGDGLEVALGGGRRHFLPESVPDPENRKKSGRRKDNRDLTKEWLKKYNKSQYVWNKEQFDAINPESTEHLLGLFERSHMEYESDRMQENNEPSLVEMTKKALQILKKNSDGYFLMVEAGRIDHAHHINNAYRALTDTIELSNAVRTARQMTDQKDTLIIVTADHSHVFTMAGYPTRGNPILGKVITNKRNGKPEKKFSRDDEGNTYTTLNYANGPGFALLDRGGDTRYKEDIDAGHVPHLDKVDTEDEGYHQEALVPLRAETHGGEDVAVYADGPGAYLFHGVIEQNVIYHVMKEASAMTD